MHPHRNTGEPEMMSHLVLYTKLELHAAGIGCPYLRAANQRNPGVAPTKNMDYGTCKVWIFASGACIEIEACSCAENWTGIAGEACDSFFVVDAQPHTSSEEMIGQVNSKIAQGKERQY
jgi:hypothetical protein